MSETAPLSAPAGRPPSRRDPAPGAGVPPADPAADLPGCRVAAPADASPLPGGGLTGMFEQARAAQARLGDQPLPIANRDMLLITKLLGG